MLTTVDICMLFSFVFPSTETFCFIQINQAAFACVFIQMVQLWLETEI